VIAKPSLHSHSVQAWRQWIEPWYLVYALLGAVAAGLIPVLLPLIASKGGSAAQVGLVVAAVSLGGLTAPAWGSLADRYRLHRWLLVGGLLIITASLAGIALTANPALRFIFALLEGAGAAGASTVANLFVVEAHPKQEWDERIGWLQTFYGVGQVAGLLLAGFLVQPGLQAAVMVTAALSAAAALLAWLTAHTPPAPTGTKPVLLHAATHGEWTSSSPQRMFHHLGLKAWKKLGEYLVSPFGLFLLVWVLTFAGPAAVFSQFPVLMQNEFRINPGISSTAFAIAAGLGLALYFPAGTWSRQIGPWGVLRIAWGIRLLAAAGLVGLGFTGLGLSGWLALLAFALIVMAWSAISVAGTALAARLSSTGEGEGLGIFNAATALAGVIGALLGGWAAATWGFGAINILAVIGIFLGLGLSMTLLIPNHRQRDASHDKNIGADKGKKAVR
jgi:DHA1 family tetracycline resistance protein-like MFS transporter